MMLKFTNCALVFCFLLSPAFVCLAQEQRAPDEIRSISDALRDRDYRKALELSKTALAGRPNDYRLWTLRGMATAGTANLPFALSAYQHALKLAPTYLPALEGAAQSEFQMGHDTARTFILRVLALRPDDPTSHAMLGILEYKNKNCPDAVAHFEKATPVIGSQADALTQYGSCLAILKNDQQAVTVFAQALALDPAKRDARYNLALAQANAGQANDALASLRPLIDATPIDREAANLAAEILEGKSDTAQAIDLLRKTILANPQDVDAYLQFAALSYDHASPKVGIDILNAGLTQLPEEPRLYLVRGVLLTQLGEFANAAEDFETANRIDPRLQFLGVAEALVRSQQHKPAEALIKFRAAVKANPKDAFSQYLLAEALQESGKPVGTPEYKEEVEAATRAVRLDPHLVAAHDLLSTIYLEDGHTGQSIQHSRAALALDSNDQKAVYHLIVALRKSDQKDQVPALLKRLLELRTNTKVNEKTSKRFRLYEVTAQIDRALFGPLVLKID